MDRKKYNQIRIIIVVFVAAIVGLAIAGNDYLLSIAGVITGVFFMALVGAKAKFEVDEREMIIREKAARLTYTIFAPTIGIGALLLLIPSFSGLSVFAKGDFIFLESLGMILAYLTLFLIIVYAISHHFIDRKCGGGRNEE